VRAVHNKPLGLMKLDVQFSLPKVDTLALFLQWKCLVTCPLFSLLN
jgi:hypothetical protein